MKKIIILCSLLVMVSLTTIGQEINISRPNNNEINVIQKNKVLLYSTENKKRMWIDEEILITLLSKSKIVCCKIDTIETGKFIKTIEVEFPNSSHFISAYFESNYFEDNKEILVVKYTEFDKEDSYMVVFNNTNKRLIILLNKMLKAAPLFCKEDNSD